MWLSLKSCASSSLKIHTFGLDMRKNKIPMTWHCFESSKCESIHLWYFSITMQRETLVVGLPWPNMHGQTYFWSSISTWSKKYFSVFIVNEDTLNTQNTQNTQKINYLRIWQKVSFHSYALHSMKKFCLDVKLLIIWPLTVLMDD